ncbi:ABC-type sugar transport system, substrate-binding protein, contains N-terminal xre family HTH domain [Sporobacter termitidis DSM 10068]|uniref:ABC-type sugar transport system, substrate-binding protein, contains N-terminal xre family HTH domain n=1 Tax=Sporobacter termitidis DSM 10068 TaxID=1123282 RepID=A0A1M5YDG5_9FIRM|nr:sugar ABC transporter substrate-binding protein [Sporobacter termitidis]SHI10121.1 ABC-type sugar transport system, substrate-binding protein, contains N-terminal xre family HTH domain [Sporobacter termitidis DSM 10068]
MKKVKRALTLILLVLTVAALLASCTGNTATTTPGTPPSASAGASPSGGGTESGQAGAGKLGGGKDIYNDPVKIAWIPLSTAGQVNQVIDLVWKDAVRIYPNVTITAFDPGYDINKQISMINEAITDKYDAIMLLAMDTAACNDAITQAEKAGIPVLTVDCGATAVHTFHLQGTDYGSGQLAGQVVAKALNNTGSYLVLDAPAEQKAIGRMGAGFIDYMNASTQCKMLEDVSIPNWSQENANTTMRDLLTKYQPGQLQAVYCASDDIAMGALQAIQAAGRDKEGIILYGNVGYLPVLNAIKAGQIYGTNYSDTYAHFYTVFHMALYFIETGTTAVTAGYTATPVVYDTLIPVDKSNVDYIMSVSRYAYVQGQ